MTQLRRHSILEVCLNTASGFVVSYCAGLVIFPAFGFHISASQNFWIVWLYTLISIARSYFWRRLFNWWQVKTMLSVRTLSKH